MLRKRYVESLNDLPCVIVACCLALAIGGCAAPKTDAAAAPTASPAAAEPALKPHDYMAALRRSEESAVAADDDRTKRAAAFQVLATEQSMVGDTEAAIANFDSAVNRQSVRDPDLVEAETVLAQHAARDAIATIVDAARDRQVVILNEAHHVPRHRAFATALALELRKTGFEYFAVETLEERTPALAARGYPLVTDGYYSREPVFGDLIRRALAAGYVPIAYEHIPDAPPPANELDWSARIALREEGQARNLVDRVFAKNPAARVFIYVGYSHALEEPVDAGEGRKTSWMAARLREKTGIDPLTIDQATTRPVLAPLGERAFAAVAGDSAVLVSRAGGGFWTIKPGFDLTVLHRATRIEHGRPHWLAMGGYRAPWNVPAKLLPKKGRRLVQAFVANETADAVPVDQVIVEATKPPPKLMLPKGNYRFAVQN
jgi:hypothetical protein